MLKEQCRVGMEVVFGRGNGEQTRGVVTKLNRVKAKVRTTDSRGKAPVGAEWGVPYGMMEPVGATTGGFKAEPAIPVVSVAEVVSVADQPVQYSPFQNHSDVLILEAINCVYNELSPENLCCDGELPTHLVHRKRGELNRKLDGLFKAFGRPVSETVAWDWSEKKREYRRANV